MATWRDASSWPAERANQQQCYCRFKLMAALQWRL